LSWIEAAVKYTFSVNAILLWVNYNLRISEVFPLLIQHRE
jgi:hypothetical protein